MDDDVEVQDEAEKKKMDPNWQFPATQWNESIKSEEEPPVMDGMIFERSIPDNK